MTDEKLLPDSDHVVRYVRSSRILDDGRVNCSAFQLNEDEEGLSVNWLECFKNKTKPQQLEMIRSLSRLKPGTHAKLAELNVGTTLKHFLAMVAEYYASNPPNDHISYRLRFLKTPLCAIGEYEADPSHCDIMGLPPEDSPYSELIGDILAECVMDLHPAKV